MEKKRGFGIGQILRFSRHILGGETFTKILTEKLKEDTWDLIHYVGHSMFHLSEDKA